MSSEDNKRAVAEFVRRCQNQHDLDFADEVFHPEFVNHYRPEGRPIPETARPASGFHTGQRVRFTFERPGFLQDGYSYRALAVWPEA